MHDLVDNLEQDLVEEAFAVAENRSTHADREIINTSEDSLQVRAEMPEFAEGVLMQYGFESIGAVANGNMYYARRTDYNSIQIIRLSWSDEPADPRSWIQAVERENASAAYIKGHPHGIKS